MNRFSLVAVLAVISVGLASCGSKSATEANFREAAASEGAQGIVYKAYARNAAAEGHTSVAALFSALASSEEVHSKLLDKKTTPPPPSAAVDSTLKNLYQALANQEFDANNFFPEISRTATAEKASRAEKTLQMITKAELSTAELLRQAIMSLEAAADTSATIMLARVWMVCQKCGTVMEADPKHADECPNCGKNVKRNAVTFQ